MIEPILEAWMSSTTELYHHADVDRLGSVLIRKESLSSGDGGGRWLRCDLQLLGSQGLGRPHLS